MKTKYLIPIAVAAALSPSSLRADETKPWSFDVTLYGLAAGMAGDVVVKGVSADVDMGFDQIWDNLEFGAMGKIRVGYNRWAINTDVIYMGLQASANGWTVEMDQWVVEPTLSYVVCPEFELLAGTRYNNLAVDLRGTGPLGIVREKSGTQEWWDPIVGANVSVPLGEKFSFNVRGDIGGFGVGSDLTWQAFPSIGWRVSRACILNAGYRWVYTDYSTGSGANEFTYDMMSQGPQFGITFQF